MECDLFEPIKSFFEELGYVCDGEVNDIDIYMQKDDSSVAVELKQTLDFRAIQQAALRQKIVETVCIGIFAPKDRFSKSFQDKLYLLKRLGIGLIAVTKRTHKVTILSEPVVSELSSFQARNKRKKKALETEFQKRRIKSNTGGVTGVKLMTRYREDALLVLNALFVLGGEAAPKDVKRLSFVDKSANILRDNHYGWFSHVNSGMYAITDSGYQALEEYDDTIRMLKATPRD
jgi:hypothetical protein